MRILFLGNEDQKMGSTRLHVHNFAGWLKTLGHDVVLNSPIDTSFDIIIAGKEISAAQLKEVRQTHPSALIGKVNPSDINEEGLETMTLSDFLVVGCIPERDHYLTYCSNVYIIPHVEEIFTKRKVHTDKEEIVIGYHGNLHHLEQMHPHLSKALERLSQEMPLKFVAIYDQETLGEWTFGRPNVRTEVVQWQLETLEEELLKIDIGVAPGLFPINTSLRKKLIRVLDLLVKSKSGFKNDYLVRYKNTTNSGREFVFHQVGIPVVSDHLPTAFHILGNPENGMLAHSEAAWYLSLKKLAKSAELRQRMTDNAIKEYLRLYNPLDWTQRMMDEIQ